MQPIEEALIAIDAARVAVERVVGEVGHSLATAPDERVLQQIDAVHAKAHDITVATESLLRATVRAQPALPISTTSPLYRFRDVEEHDVYDTQTWVSATRLVGALQHAIPNLPATASVAMAEHAITVEFDSPDQLTLVVNAPGLPWPGVNVRCYHREAPNDPENHALGARTFRLAHSVIAHVAAILSR